MFQSLAKVAHERLEAANCRGRGGVYSHFTVGLHENDPRCAVLNDYARTPFAGRLYAVTLDNPPVLDGRTPYVEAALL